MESELTTMTGEYNPELLAALSDSQLQNYFAINNDTTGTLDCMAMATRWWINDFGSMIWDNGRYYINSPSVQFMGCDIMFRVFKESTFKNNFVLICSDPQRLQNVEVSLKHKAMNGQIFKWIKCTEFYQEKNFRNLITTKNLLDSFEKTGSSDLLVECEFVIRTARGYSLLKRKHGEMIAISSTDRLHLIDRKWKSCANMVMSRAAHALVSHREKLYAFGGRNPQGSILASVEMYDPRQDFWFEIASLPRPAMGLSATCIKDSVWLIGGITDHPSENPAECLSSNVFSFVPSVKKKSEA